MGLGLLSVLAAWTYTGGKDPYGYRGWGEVAAFFFFGPIATVGTAYLHISAFPWEAWVAGSAAGCFAAAVLLENNLRDRQQDRRVGKRTLVVLIGEQPARWTVTFLLVLPYLLLGILWFEFVWAPVALVTAVLAIYSLGLVWKTSASRPNDLIRALQWTAVNGFLYAAVLALVIGLHPLSL